MKVIITYAQESNVSTKLCLMLWFVPTSGGEWLSWNGSFTIDISGELPDVQQCLGFDSVGDPNSRQGV